ncbi:hypothetical protein ACQEVG_37805 [Streptomyces sp. CA-135486]|uniref:hypothetical protein n=1 Tax=Streptomyces sp. CA-135486 TaxID=3240049 RepID=UPI003D8F19F5
MITTFWPGSAGPVPEAYPLFGSGTCSASATPCPPTNRASFLRIECKTYSGGASGGPFLVRKRAGWGIIGVIGGWHTGGNVDDISYSSYLDGDAKKLYDDAVNNRPPASRGESIQGSCGRVGGTRRPPHTERPTRRGCMSTRVAGTAGAAAGILPQEVVRVR